MPCYVCAKCECIENTALGHYWCRSRVNSYAWPEDLLPFKGQPLCSECAPTRHANGEPTGYGEWHGRFPKEHWSAHFLDKPAAGLLY